MPLVPDGPGGPAANSGCRYPYAVEHDGKLYVGYAVKDQRTAEMAIIPVSSRCGCAIADTAMNESDQNPPMSGLSPQRCLHARSFRER